MVASKTAVHESYVTSVISNSYNPMDYCPPGSFVYRIFQARILEWIAISFSKDLPKPEVDQHFPMDIYPVVANYSTVL